MGAIVAGASLLGGTAFNLLECGTVGNIGCVKEGDTAIDKKGEIAARQIIEAVRLGRLTADQGKAQIAGIWRQMNQAWTQKARSGQTASFDGFCGSDPKVSPPYNVQIGAPADSPAVTYLCGQTLTREQMFTQAFPSLIDHLAATAQAAGVGGALASLGNAAIAAGGRSGAAGPSPANIAVMVLLGVFALKVLL